ncbi:alpha/beta fold hydrolase [Acuticoccus sp.]|uniref:alpha/beta fold hydrolase n=1 Tax=Acuticoccus sp. TaxID=1904378 RepID=UPI003B527AF0
MTDDGITFGSVENDGLTLRYAETGAGDLVVLLHGFPEHWRSWRNVMTDLSSTHRVVALDTRGIAGSDAAPDVAGYAVPRLVSDVVALIEGLGAEDVTLVGHDWGGFIAWETAIARPDLLDRLVIVNAGHPFVFGELLRKDEAQREASRYMLAFRSERGEELLARSDFARFREEILAPAQARGALSEEDAAAYLDVWRDGKSLTAGLNYYRAAKVGPPSGEDGAPRDAASTTVRVPTLVIWGMADPYFVRDNLALHEVVPDLTLAGFEDSGHWIIHERPQDVARLIAGFADAGR